MLELTAVLTLSCSTEHWPKEWHTGAFKTNNAMGVMTLELSPVSQAFIDFCQSVDKPVLDIGAAYGSITYPALQCGAEVFACDIDQRHLEILREGVPQHFQPKLHTRLARFPQELDLEKNSLSAIHISLVLHFLSGDEISSGLKKCYEWSASEGKLFISAMTPDHGLAINEKTLYETRVMNHEQWPGELYLNHQAPHHWKDQLPPLTHFLTPEVLAGC
jgi:ribosomal protein L11 methylase PrmA